MLAICGAVARRDRLKRTHQTMDASAALRPVTKYVGEVDDPDDVTEAIANALRAAVTEPRGAAAVILPMDVAAAPTGARIQGPMPVPSLGPAPRDRIRRAVELIRDAERPVVLAGLRSAGPDACAALRELLAGTDLPVVETFQAAGVVSRKLEDHDATVVADVGSNYIYTARHFRSYEPGHLLFSNGQQTLGVALPWAMAAALLRPATQVVSISGDGGFLFTAQELETATRLGLRLTHVILRDDTYDMVAFQEKLKYGRTSGIRLGDYDVVQYAGAFGARGIRVSTMEEFEAELRNALSRETLTMPGVTVIDVRVDYSHNAGLFAHLHDGVLT
ncbi:hypothetical protein Hesp01_70580 [Herbidospora sp. NBRC 101105]|nr:hypothetical protein Hesp01_70580 [Herbidospora sp. NBRC 101105]